MKFNVLYEDENVLVIDKPAGIVVFPEGKPSAFVPLASGTSTDKEEKTLIDYLLEKYPDLKKAGEAPRYGIVHRLDKDTSGILLVAKNNKTLIFLQKQFKKGDVVKKYLALVIGNLKNEKGVIETLIGRAPKNRKKQKVYLSAEPGSEKKREAITGYEIKERFKDYTLIDVFPKTGRKHQIRCHFSYLGHPITGDKMYGFKNQPCLEELKRQFLHASHLKIKLPDGEIKEFKSELPEDLNEVLKKLNSNK